MFKISVARLGLSFVPFPKRRARKSTSEVTTFFVVKGMSCVHVCHMTLAQAVLPSGVLWKSQIEYKHRRFLFLQRLRKVFELHTLKHIVDLRLVLPFLGDLEAFSVVNDGVLYIGETTLLNIKHLIEYGILTIVLVHVVALYGLVHRSDSFRKSRVHPQHQPVLCTIRSTCSDIPPISRVLSSQAKFVTGNLFANR